MESLLLNLKDIKSMFILFIIFQEYNISGKCLEDNKYEANNCIMQFENYKLCRKFWVIVHIYSLSTLMSVLNTVCFKYFMNVLESGNDQ